MEPHPGVFVSKAATDDWTDIEGHPGQWHELVHADGVWGVQRMWLARCR